MNWGRGSIVSLFVLLLTFTSECTAQESQPLPLLREWSGSLQTRYAVGAMQIGRREFPYVDLRVPDEFVYLIVDETHWETLWASWRFADELPKVDFSDEYAIVATTLGSPLSLSATVDDDGRLSVDVNAPSDISPGFRYVIAIVFREKIRTFDQPTWNWTGSLGNTRLMDIAPSVISRRDQWEELWKSWTFVGVVPKVDFSNQIMVTAVTRGGRLRLSTHLDDKGDLRVTRMSTADIRRGFRYVIATVLRHGVETVNGEQLPAE